MEEAVMNKDKLVYVSYWLRRFLNEHLVTERNLSSNTRKSYRDTFKQLIPFVATSQSVRSDNLEIIHLSDVVIKNFLSELEYTKGCSVSTRNQRLSAIHAFARYVANNSPEYLEWCRILFNIPMKRDKVNIVDGEITPELSYLERAEIDALLNCPNTGTVQGRRDHALLLFMYNSGARVSEAASLTIGNLHIKDKRVSPTVVIYGKGGKQRTCPLWDSTVNELLSLTENRSEQEPVFLNKYGNPITRAGIFDLVKKYAVMIEDKYPSIKQKRVSPHTIRHTTASHLLEAGVDINTIRAWLGHVSIDTTNIYAEVNIRMKTEALRKCEVTEEKEEKVWKDGGIMAFLSSI